jgi:hypothetical protein
MFREDKRHGHGNFIWPDGAAYEGYAGLFIHSIIALFGWPCLLTMNIVFFLVTIIHTISIEISEFRNGQREGQGVYKFSDGGKYEGSWRDGRYSGFGICSWEDGRCYKGYVKEITYVPLG